MFLLTYLLTSEPFHTNINWSKILDTVTIT